MAADVFGLEPAQIGIALGSTTVGFMLGAGLSARLVERIEPMRLILVGRVLPIFAVGAAVLYYKAGGVSVAPLFLSTVVAGLGNGLSLANANAGALSVRPDLAGSASGVGGAIALGLGAVLSWFTTAVLGGGATPEGLLLLILAALSLGAGSSLGCCRLGAR